jgi:thiol-disulfide isomerase/thioredoxin
MNKDWKKYLLAFIITATIFATAILVSSWIDGKRVEEVRSIQDSLSLNILSSETQFNLLKSAACDDLFTSDIGQELGDLSDKLSYFESVGRGSDLDVQTLKRYYSLLEIKDYMLINSATKCKNKPVTILYFYDSNCDECKRQSDILTYLREHGQNKLRVYSFDQDLDVPAIQTLANIYKVKKPFPVLVIKGKAYGGLKSLEDIEKLAPEIMATSTMRSSISNSSSSLGSSTVNGK